MRLVLMGPPASGKGTQAARLREAYRVETISTGAMLRGEIEAGTVLGEGASRHLERGRLLPDDLMLGVVRRWVEDREGGFVLDGFPRTLRQGEAFDEILAEAGWELTAAVFLDTPRDLLEARVIERRHCVECGMVVRLGTHVESAGDPCPTCGGELVKRSDDTLEVFHQRMDEYEEKTIPVVRYYEEKKKLLRIRGEGGADMVFKRLDESLGALRAAGDD
ncbi:MAG: nucleoside monophosphate kinase [Verrucomicrobiota bacterium]